MCYDDLASYQAHPFTQFSGVSSSKRVGDKTLGTLSIFNNRGFVGRDIIYDKPEKVVRIAALGGSTTARGYPAIMEHHLNEHRRAGDRRYEALNFGHGYYTSAHSMVNFVLNVVDYNPDYVVIHHGWNDIYARAPKAEFRGDYSHHLKKFEFSNWRPDIFIVCVSVLYRTAKKLLGPPSWAFVENAAMVPRERPARLLQSHELQSFRRNIVTIIDLALMRNIAVILTTMPRTTDASKSESFDETVRIDQLNEIAREIGRDYENQIEFIDFAEKMTGKREEWFVDLGHLNAMGQRFKAEQIGNRILEIGGRMP